MVDVFMINSSVTNACVFMNQRRSVLAHQGTKQKGRKMAFGVFVNNINQIRKDDLFAGFLVFTLDQLVFLYNSIKKVTIGNTVYKKLLKI